MKQSQVLLLSFVLGALLVVGYFAGLFGGKEATFILPKWTLQAKEVNAIEIQAPKQPLLKLMKGVNGWYILAPQEAPADSNAVNRLLNQLSALQPETIVANQKDRFGKFGVDSTARVIRVTSGKEIRTLYIGTTAPNQTSFYLRMDQDPRVLQVAGLVGTSVDLNDWRAQFVLRLPVSSIERVQATTPEGTYEVAASPQGWQVIRDGKTTKADSVSVLRWLNRFIDLRADGYLKEVKAASMATSITHRLQFHTTGGGTRIIRFKKRDSDVWGVVDGTTDVFQISLPQLVLNVPNADELVKTSPVLAAPKPQAAPQVPPQTLSKPNPVKRKRGEEGEAGL